MIVKVYFPFEKSPYVKTVQTDIKRLRKGELVVVHQEGREKTGIITYIKNIEDEKPFNIKAKVIRKADELDHYEFWSKLEDKLLRYPLKITDSVYEKYKLTRGNSNISREQAEKKLTRNLLLSHKSRKMYIDELKISLQYGALRLYYQNGMIVKLKNKCKAPRNWEKDLFAYDYFGKLLGIEEGELVG